MAKQKKYTLEIDDEKTAFELIGISSHHNDYRLAWNINNTLNYKFVHSENPFIITFTKKNEIIHQSHTMYEYYDEENRVNFSLIKNKEKGKFLIPERSSIDFFLFIEENEVIDTHQLSEKLRKVESILATFVLDCDTLPSTKHIIF
ncbi:MAG TPA: IPExxxVDY family protein [Taishania sp.]|nr:IPExxxVDY family protein [Taishania sp.]